MCLYTTQMALYVTHLYIWGKNLRLNVEASSIFTILTNVVLSCGGPSSWRLPHAMCVAVAPSPIRVLSIDVLLFQGTLVPSDDDWWCWDSFCLLICPPCRQNWWQAEIRLLWVIVSLIDVYLYQRRKLNPYNSIINHIHQTAILELVTTRCRFHKLFCTLHQSFVPYAELLRW